MEELLALSLIAALGIIGVLIAFIVKQGEHMKDLEAAYENQYEQREEETRRANEFLEFIAEHHDPPKK